MKRFIIIFLLTVSSIAKGQIYSPTGGGTGSNATPDGWTSTGVAFGSSNTHYSEVSTTPWVFAPLPPAPSGQPRFLSLRSSNGETQMAKMDIYNLQPGIWYEIKYHVMTAAHKYAGSNQTELATMATAEVSGEEGAFNSHIFQGINSLKWTEGSLKFLAGNVSETFKFHVKSPNSPVGAVANLDISSIKMACAVSGSDVRFEHPILFKRCPESTVNLNDAFTGNIPVGTALVWYKNATHSGNPVIGTNMIGQPGEYYGFFKDTQNNCFNTDLAHRKVIVHQADVKLKSDIGQITCHGETKFDLNTLHDTPPSDIPPGAQLVWFNNPSHSGFPAAVGNSTSVPPGIYYAFYYFGAPYNCYNTDLSTDKVEVKLPTQVTLGFDRAHVVCIDGKGSLAENPASGVPEGSQLVYYTTPDASGPPVANYNDNPIGEYYAFSYDPVKQCLNTALSTTKFTIAQLPELPVTTLNVECETKTLNLDTLYNAPVGRLVWFTNDHHVMPKPGTPPLNPKAVGPGIYWAFYYDDIQKCYNVPVSTAKFVVKDTVCKSRVVYVNLKVKLQGAIVGTDSTMKNTLQTYAKDLGGFGVLPTKDPYGGEVVYEEINNVNGPLGAIVDWIKVELRSAANPATILATQSLLLTPNGKVITPTGSSPYFDALEQPVHMVIKHRNHVAVMSQTMLLNGEKETVGYDFTKSLDKAHTDGEVPTQMLLINGVWCMISGDVSQNLIVKNEDMNQTRNAYNQGLFEVYSTRDLNMNGIVNNQDANIQRNRYNIGYFSILTNY